MVENCNACIGALKSHDVSIPFISAEGKRDIFSQFSAILEISSGNGKMILTLMWSLVKSYQVRKVPALGKFYSLLPFPDNLASKETDADMKTEILTFFSEVCHSLSYSD